MNIKARIAIRLALGVALAVTAIARVAHGETPPAGSSAALTPPRLSTFVDAVYPADARGAHPDDVVTVDLELTIDATGAVTDARVAHPVGEGFDEAALAAARRFVFEPARRGTEAIPARIKYRYAFEPPPASPPPATTGALEGHVLVRADERAAVGTAVTLIAADGERRSATTGPDGAFAFANLVPGQYRVQLVAPNLHPLSAEEEISAGELTSVTYRLAAQAPVMSEDGALEYGATATVEAPARETTKRTLQASELLNLAGTRGDPLRGIEYMPGVARSPMANFVIIRGASPADSDVLFEGAPVNRLYHFWGLTSFVQPRLLERIDLYPGNFSARFGRKMGGIIDVGIRDPKTDGFHGMVDVNLIDSSFLFEGPLTKHLSFAVAAKRSYIDFFFDRLVPKDEVQVLAAPVYWDYQALVTYKPSDSDRVRLMVYGSYDDFKLILAHPDDADPTIRGKLSQSTSFHRAQLFWEHKYSPAVEHEVSVTTGPFKFGQAVGPSLVLDVPGYDGFLRAEWRVRAHDRLRVLAGVDVAATWILNGNYNGPRITQLDGDPSTFGPLTGQTNYQVHRDITFIRPGGYLEAIWTPTARWTLVPGARADYIGDIQRWTFDPRLTSRYQLSDATTLKGGVGLFSQAPDFSETLPIIGNPHLRAPRAQHYSLGVEQHVTDRLLVTVEGFYKRLSLLTVNSPVPGENLNNDGVGRIYGGELSARLRPTDQSTGFLSYTLSRSQRRDHAGDDWRLFNWDQTHILTVSGAHALGRGWNLSGTFRYVTGTPYTPVVASVYNSNTDTYKAVYGAVNGARSNAFHRLDVRIEKTWAIRSGSLALYLDVQNAYDHQGDEGRVYNYNFTQSGTIPGLPIIPSLGLRGEI
jgi:TonB family protein